MLPLALNQFQHELRKARSLFHLNEWVRGQHISLPSDFELEISLAERKEYSRVFDHSGALTRLYSTYERYIFQLVEISLKLLSTCKYDLLTDKEVKDLFENYRVHCGFCLQYFSEHRLESIGSQKLLISATRAVRGRRTETLIAEAFFSNLNNLRLTDLVSLLSNVKMKEASKYLSTPPYMRDFLDGVGSTLDAYLKIVYSKAK